MALRKRKTPSHDERWGLANDKVAAAIGWAEDAINVLEEAADDHAVLANDVDDEIIRLEQEVERLHDLRDRALTDYDATVNVAGRIASLVGV